MRFHQNEMTNHRVFIVTKEENLLRQSDQWHYNVDANPSDRRKIQSAQNLTDWLVSFSNSRYFFVVEWIVLTSQRSGPYSVCKSTLDMHSLPGQKLGANSQSNVYEHLISQEDRLVA